MNGDEYAAWFTEDIKAVNRDSIRSRQKADGKIGASDFDCRERMRFIITKTPETDQPEKWSAFVGTALDDALQAARAARNPHLLFKQRLPLTLDIGGGRAHQFFLTPDEIDPNEPSVTDFKTANGLALARKKDMDDQRRIQRHLQAAAVIENGLAPAEGFIVRNVVVDRSGKDASVVVEQEPYNLDIVRQAGRFLADVIYAVEHGERAAQDRYRSFCSDWCPWFTACRGDEIQYPPIFDARQRALIELYFAAVGAEKEATELRAEIRPMLEGLTGITADKQFKITTTVQNRKTGAVTMLRIDKLVP